METPLRILLMMNLSLATGGAILYFLQRWVGKVPHGTSTTLLLLCLLMPAAGHFNPLEPIQNAKVSAQEYLGSTLSPPVLPGEDLESLPQAFPAITTTVEESEPFQWAEILRVLLVLGIFAFSLRWLILYARLQRILRSCVVHKTFNKFKLLVHPKLSHPFSTFQGFTPVIVLPQNLLNSSDKLWVLRHELQHVRQGDLYLTFILELLVPLTYFNPIFWWWKANLKESMEFSCDARIIRKYPEQKKEYAHALINVAEQSLRRTPSFNLCAGMASLGREDQSMLTRRIKMIVTKKKLKPWQTIVSGGLVALASTLAFSAGVPMKTTPRGLPEASRTRIKEILVDGIRTAGSKRGHLIVTNPKTGEVLYAKGFARDGAELEDDYLSTPYAPHSLMKPVITALALEAGRTKLDSVHDCKGGVLKIGDKEYKDYRNFKRLTTRETLIHSSNVCGIRIAQTLSNEDLATGLQKFGFGSGSKANAFSGAAGGFLRDYPESEAQYYAPNLTIGYHAIFTTPLEVTQAYGALFNGGEFIAPATDSKSTARRRVLSPEVAEQIKKTLAEVVDEGTGSRARDPNLAIAGKTSSSPGAPYDLNNRMSFIGAAPAKSPTVLVYVTLDGAEKGKSTGSKHAAPIARKILTLLE